MATPCSLGLPSRMAIQTQRVLDLAPSEVVPHHRNLSAQTGTASRWRSQTASCFDNRQPGGKSNAMGEHSVILTPHRGSLL